MPSSLRCSLSEQQKKTNQDFVSFSGKYQPFRNLSATSAYRRGHRRNQP
jgi:hypothetical protein